jgi:hypothetical protein
MIRIHCKGRVMRVAENGDIGATLERWRFVGSRNQADSTCISDPSLESDPVAARRKVQVAS